MTTSLSKTAETDTDAPAPLAFIDLAAQQARIRPQLDAAIARVLDHGKYIMGPEVRAFEQDMAGFCGAAHAVSCSSGTDALLMVLMAKEIGPGDAVICPAFTFTATPEVIALLGATPVFADVREDTFNLDPEGLEAAVDAAKAAGLTPKAIMVVDLFGLPADYEAIESFADAHGLWVLADAAQGFGGTYKNRKVGKLGLATATSFFPAKPLGCYGDGGAILTDDDDLAARLESIRVHGKGTDKYDNVRIGINGRLDTMQAAILIEKLKIFADEIEARDKVAAHYTAALSGNNGVSVPVVPEGLTSVWAQYTLRVPTERRDVLAASMKAKGVPTAIYYPKPLHHQTAYRDYPVPAGGLAVSERLATEVLSLPMHPYLDEKAQDRVVTTLLGAL
ncbi:MAG: DegT/DnrJ/EryC1/StrS aminotransferase family protein [Pseudomonadota bacterium]